MDPLAWTEVVAIPLGMAAPSLYVPRTIHGYFRRPGMTWEASYSIRGLYMGTLGTGLATQLCQNKLMPLW